MRAHDLTEGIAMPLDYSPASRALQDHFDTRRLADRLAEVKGLTATEDEIDARVFSCLRDLEGCQRLMSEIARQYTFVPAATWLEWHGGLLRATRYWTPPAAAAVVSAAKRSLANVG